MPNYQRSIYQGRVVSIDFNAKKVRVRRYLRWLFWKPGEWSDVPLEDLDLNTWWPQSIGTSIGRFSISDLPLTIKQISEGLGVVRLDSQGASRIWESARSLKGENVALDFTER